MGSGLSGLTDVLAPQNEPFNPSIADARLATVILSARLPPELALLVLDYAEYWPEESSTSARHVVVRAGARGELQSAQVLVSNTIAGGEVERCVRRVSITTESRDQGFSSFPEQHGTREGSSSWFEAALIRRSLPSPDAPPLTPPVWKTIVRTEVHRNVHASRTFEVATRVFERGDRIVDEAVKGDRIVVFALAQYPLWVNDVKEVGVAVEVMV